MSAKFFPEFAMRLIALAVVTPKEAKVQWRTVLVLASSRKNNAICVAGREWTQTGFGPWLRPVSGHGKGELSFAELRMDSGQVARVGDVVRVPFGHAAPDGAQQENLAVLPNRAWEHVGLASWDMLSALVESPAMLWSNGCHVQNDRVPEMEGSKSDKLVTDRIPGIRNRVRNTTLPSSQRRGFDAIVDVLKDSDLDWDATVDQCCISCGLDSQRSAR